MVVKEMTLDEKILQIHMLDVREHPREVAGVQRHRVPKLIVLSILLTDLLTTVVDAWRQPWTPWSASELYGPVSWTVVDLPGLAQPPERRKA